MGQNTAKFNQNKDVRTNRPAQEMEDVDDQPLSDKHLVPLFEAISDVTDWFALGLALGISRPVLEQIRNENQSERNRTVGMLRKWLESGTASWSILVNTLRSPSIDNHHLADEIARLHPKYTDQLPIMQGAHSQFLTDNYKKAFQDAVKERGSLCTTYMAHCLAFGPLGSGKTSLLHRLIDKPLGTLAACDKSSSSSRSDDMMVPKYIIATGDKWHQIPNLEEVAVKLAEFAANPLSALIPQLPLNILLEVYERQSKDLVSDDTLGTNPTASLRYDKILHSIRDSKLLDNSTIITYIDHGSQPEFQEMVPVLLAGPAIFLFIFSLAEGLDSKYTASYGSSDSEHHLYKSPFTVKEVFMHILSSIASYHSVSSLKSRVSPLSILVVGTHKNRVNKAKVSEIDEELKQAVEDTSLHKSGAIAYFSKEQLIIPVDNYNENNDSASVRNVVERIVKKHGSPYRIEFPIPWLAFDFALRKCPPTVTYKKCTEIAKNYDISEKDLPKCLSFLHHGIGSIRYYGSVNELKDIVVIQPTVIFEAISGLIINTSSQFKKFRNLGLLERDTLENIFAHYQDKLQISCDAFIALLNRFNILEPSHDPELGDYFFPCALVRAPNPPSEINLDPLLVLFEGGFVPTGVFSALLVFLLREMEWRIQRDDKGLPLLYRNQASFDDGKDCLITLKATAKCLEVFVEGKQAGSTTHSLYNIRQILEIGVFNACKSLRYDQSFYSRKFGFYCNLPKCARHIAEVDLKNKEIECPPTNKRYPVNSEREYWFITDKPGFPTISEDTVKKAKQKIYSRCREMPNAQGIIFVIGMFDSVGTDDIVERMSSIFYDDLNFAVYREKIVTSTDLACLVKAVSEYNEYPRSYRFVAFYYAGYGGVDGSGYEYLLPMQLTGGNDADVLYIENNILSPFRSGIPQNFKFLFFFDCCLSNDSNEDDQLTTVTKKFDLKAPSAGLVAYATSSNGYKFSNNKIYVGLWTQYLCERITRARSLSTILGDAREDFVKDIGEDEYMFPKPRYGTHIGEVYLTESGHMYMYAKAFQDAVEKEGSIPMHMVQLMPFGPPRVGKTCLLNRLLNRDAPGIRATCDSPGSGSDSTIVLDNRKMIYSTFVADGGDWKEIKNLADESAFYIKSSTESQFVPKDSSDSVNESATPTVSDNCPIMPLLAPVKESNSQISIENLTVHSPSRPQSVTKFNDEPRLKVGNVPVRPGPDSDTSVTHTGSNLLDELLNSMKSKDMTKVQKLLNDTMTIFYTDTGGQPEFQEVLPALVAGPTIFLLIFSLAKGLACLGTRYTVTYRAPDGESVPYESSFTVKEVFLQCLSSIASYHNALSRDVTLLNSNTLVKTRVPPLSVLTVATHKDLLIDEEKVRKIDKELRGPVEQTSLYKSGCIEYCPDEDKQLIIPVDNYNEKNDSNAVKKAVQIIIRRKQGKESPYKIEFPVPWLALELSLRHLLQSIITYQECIEIAKQCNVARKDLPYCLWFLHHKTGTIRYYHGIKVLKDYIIVKPDVIFKAVSKLITNTFTREKALNPEVMDFKRLGLFKRNTLEDIFTDYHSELQINCDVFLALLEHLNILGPVHDPEFSDYDYFLPCALVHAPEPLSSEDQLDPLLVLFKGGFVPKGVFSALLVYLLREKEWVIQHDNREPRLYRNQVYFYTDSSGIDCPVSLKATAERFEVHIESKQANSRSWHKICQILEIGIHNVCKHLRYDDSFCTHQFGFYCDHADCADKDKHIAKVDSTKKNMTCSLTNRPYPVNKDREHWFITKEPDCVQFSDDAVKEAKRKIRKKCQNKPHAQGIIFIADMLFVGAFGNPGGTDVDADNICKIFRDDLNFATYRIEDPSCPELACLVQAAAEFDKYPLNYDFIAFYYAGHGGIDESCREFVLPDDDTKNILYIKDDIISPLTSAAKLGRKYIFFFDCCLNYSPGLDVHGTEKVFNLESPQDCLVAYATSINHKAGGNKTYGGLWTRHLCQRLKKRDLLSAILDHTVEDVRDDQVTSIENDKVTYQLPHYVTNAGEVYLKEEEVKQTPEKVETVSQPLTNKIHGQPTITLQHSRKSEKSSKSDSDDEDEPVAKKPKLKVPQSVDKNVDFPLSTDIPSPQAQALMSDDEVTNDENCRVPESDPTSFVCDKSSPIPSGSSQKVDLNSPPSEVDLFRCSRCFSGDVDLTDLAGVVNVCDEELEGIKKKYKKINSQALQLLQKWKGPRQDLYKILIILDLSEAAEKLINPY